VRLVTALLCAATAAVVPATAGHAAACPAAIADPAGDAPSPDLDIVRAEIATGARTLVVRLKVVSLTPPAGTPLAPVTWTVAFSSRGVTYAFYRQRGPGGATSNGHSVGTAAVPVSVTTDATTITWTASRPGSALTPCDRRATTAVSGFTTDTAT
jgi:hypothetical protein